MTDHIKNVQAASLSDANPVSEVELQTTNDGVKEAWANVQEIQRKLTKAKKDALASVDLQFKEELSEAEAHYAFSLTLAR